MRMPNIYHPKEWPQDTRRCAPKWAHRGGDLSQNELGWYLGTATDAGLKLFSAYLGMKSRVRTVYCKELDDHILVVNSYRREQTVFAIPKDTAPAYLRQSQKEAGSAELLEIALNVALRDSQVQYMKAPVEEERWDQVHERDYGR